VSGRHGTDRRIGPELWARITWLTVGGLFAFAVVLGVLRILTLR
jgi:hypothetical protein